MFVSLLVCALFQPGPTARPPAVDPHARQVLEEMVKAYHDLRSLDQTTTYDASAAGDTAPLSGRLTVQRPNRLLFEMTRQSLPAMPPSVVRVVCDGRNLYTYQQQSGWYTRSKAPRDFAGFGDVAANIELLMLSGLDPVPSLLDHCRAVRLEQPVETDGVPCDVVLVDVGSDGQTGEVRLTIGQKDRLLRGFALDSRVVERAAPDGASPEPTLPPTRFHYVNRVTANHPIPAGTFVWAQPPGAYLYQGSSNPLSPDFRPPGGRQPGPLADVKRMKLIPLSEIIKRQKRRGR